MIDQLKNAAMEAGLTEYEAEEMAEHFMADLEDEEEEDDEYECEDCDCDDPECDLCT